MNRARSIVSDDSILSSYLAVLDDDIAALVEFVSTHQSVARDLLAGLRIMRPQLDAVVGLGVEEMKGHPLAARRRGIEANGTGDERQTEIAFPTGARRHDSPGARAPSACRRPLTESAASR